MDMFDDFGDDFFCPTYSEDPLDHLMDIQDDFFAARRGSLVTSEMPADGSGQPQHSQEDSFTDSLKRPPANNLTEGDAKRPRTEAPGYAASHLPTQGTTSNMYSVPSNGMFVPVNGMAAAPANMTAQMPVLPGGNLQQLVPSGMALPHTGLPTNLVPQPSYSGIAPVLGQQASLAPLAPTPLPDQSSSSKYPSLESSTPQDKSPLARSTRPATRYGGAYTPSTKDNSRATKGDDSIKKIKKEKVDDDLQDPPKPPPEPWNKGTGKPKKPKKSSDKAKDAVKTEKDEVDEERKRQLARAKNRVHAKESRARKKLWLDELKVSVDKLKEALNTKEQQIYEMASELEHSRKEKEEFIEDQAALQSLFQTAGKSAMTMSGNHHYNQGDRIGKSNGFITRHELNEIQEHIHTARNFMDSLLSAPSTDEVLSHCSHGATFHWPVVSRYSNGTVASYISFPRTLKEMFLPDLAFSQPAITFSEDHVTLTLLMHGTHTCNRAVGTVETTEMQPSNPPRRFESTVVFTFSFNNRGKISKISKVFDVTDMYQQLRWGSMGANLNGEENPAVSIGNPFSKAFSLDDLTTAPGGPTM